MQGSQRFSVLVADMLRQLEVQLCGKSGNVMSLFSEACLPCVHQLTHLLHAAGHVVAVRVTSEDANKSFKPTAGSIDELVFQPRQTCGATCPSSLVAASTASPTPRCALVSARSCCSLHHSALTIARAGLQSCSGTCT